MSDGEGSRTSVPPNYLDRMLNILEKLPDNSLQSCKVVGAIVEFWRKSPVNSLPTDRYLEIWDRLWLASAQDPLEEHAPIDAVGYAINDSAGRFTEELLKFLWPKDAKVGSGIPKELADRLARIVGRTDHCVVDASSVIVASRAEILYAVAPEFTKQNVLSLLSWDGNPSAAAYWSAFLRTARISPDLFKLIEADCISALQNPERFDENGYKGLCQIFLLASMEFKATSERTVRDILDQIGAKGLEHMSSFLRYRMLNSKEDAANYWLQTVKPWIEMHWPRDAARQTSQTRADFAMIAIYSSASFPDALRWMEENGLLGETPTASTILYSLKRKDAKTHEDFKESSSLPERYPDDVLHLLWLTQPFRWERGNAKKILDRIIEANPALAQTAEHQSVVELVS